MQQTFFSASGPQMSRSRRTRGSSTGSMPSGTSSWVCPMSGTSSGKLFSRRLPSWLDPSPSLSALLRMSLCLTGPLRAFPFYSEVAIRDPGLNMIITPPPCSALDVTMPPSSSWQPSRHLLAPLRMLLRLCARLRTLLFLLAPLRTLLLPLSSSVHHPHRLLWGERHSPLWLCRWHCSPLWRLGKCHSPLWLRLGNHSPLWYRGDHCSVFMLCAGPHTTI